MLCKKPVFGKFGCQQCIPCLVNRRRTWVSRITLEASMHDQTSFLTLTYDDDHVPKNSLGDYTLVPKDLQNFWKRLRKELPVGSLRYYAVGEYGHDGEREWNPHFHAALFGLNCLGKMQRPETGLRCYCEVCELVRSVWQQGNITVDELNDTTASYIAGYCLKKMTSKDDYRLNGRHPEFARMSQGIARDAVTDIANAVRSEFGHLSFVNGDVLSYLNHGNHKLVLGRYLKLKLRQAIDLHHIDPATGEVKYSAPPEAIEAFAAEESPKLFALQEDIKNSTLGSSQNAKKYEALDIQRSKDKQRRLQRILNMETKHAIRKSEKKL